MSIETAALAVDALFSAEMFSWSTVDRAVMSGAVSLHLLGLAQRWFVVRAT
jgi:hypothetical protein